MATDPVQQIFTRFEKNLQRTPGLVDSFYGEEGKVGRPGTHRSDLLRAAVVLLHATLEDLLRSLEIELIDRCVHPRMRLDNVRFALPGEGKLRETIRLSELVGAYPTANVQHVLADALAAHKPERLVQLEGATYNDVGEVKRALTRVQVPSGANRAAPYGLNIADWGLIATMMARRHLIAHRADRNDNVGRGHHLAKPLSATVFQTWVDTVRKLGNSVQQRLQTKAPP